MRRLLRWAFNFAAAVSAVLFAATCVLWVVYLRTTLAADWLHRDAASAGGWHILTLTLTGGSVQVQGGFVPRQEAGAGWGNGVRIARCLPRLAPGFGEGTAYRPGFDYCRAGNEWKGIDIWAVTAPAWALAAVPGIIPAAWLAHNVKARMRRAGRRANRLCPACGYDLRATPNRCPECGAVPERA